MATLLEHADSVAADENINVRISKGLKDDFNRAIRTHPEIKNMTHFVEEAAKAFILQMRRGEIPAYPLEFVAVSKDAK